MRRRRRSRSNSPFGDEDIPITQFELGVNDNVDTRIHSQKKTAFGYDEKMLLHKNIWDKYYYENPERLTVCFNNIVKTGLLNDCLIVKVCEANKEFINLIHSDSYIQFIESLSSKTEDDLLKLSSDLADAYYHMNTKCSSFMAAGSTIEILKAVLENRARNGFCLVRPPGHHALESETCGFCIFNNVAIACKLAQLNYSAQRILILDWDVHHGQGTQYQFYNTSKVLYISMHRYDYGQFWPNLRESDYDFIGHYDGKGYNINIPFNEAGATASDYLAVFQAIVMPIAYEFNPDLILISAGFDAAIGDPEGGMNVEPVCFAIMTQKLMDLARGKVILVLEGGYCHESLSDSVILCLSTLMGKPIPKLQNCDETKLSTNLTIQNCISFLHSYWKSLSINVSSSHEPFPEYINSLDVSSWNYSKVKRSPIEESSNKYEIKPEILMELSKIRNENQLKTFVHKTSYVYDCRMENHMNEQMQHPESPRRTQLIYECLRNKNLLRKCKHIESRMASKEEICLIHSLSYVHELETNCQELPEVYHRYEQKFNSIYINQHTFSCAMLASGSLLNLVDEVCSGQSVNGFAVIRPPGHHAECESALGFCFFNNVAIAAKYALSKYPNDIKKIMIIDWDVHHGNGTQNQFWDEKRVLYISLHRFDNGLFFPTSLEGDSNKIGSGEGEGYNVNIAWNKKPIRDTEYMAAFLHIIMPIGHEYNPDLVIISSGFDAARGDPLGGLAVTPECYGHMTHMLCSLAGGKVILALEGGYNLNVISDCMSHCVCSLIGEPTVPLNHFPVNKHGLDAIRSTIDHHKKYWKCFKYRDPIPTYMEMTKIKPNSVVATSVQPLSQNEMQIDAITLSESMYQLAIVEVAFQTEQSIEESLSQQQMDVIHVEPFRLNPETSVPHASTNQFDSQHQHVTSNLVYQQPDTLSTNQESSASNSPIPIPMNATAISVDQSSGAIPISNRLRADPSNSIGLSVQDLMRLSGVQPSEIQGFLGLTPNDPLPDRIFAVQPRSWCQHLNLVCQSPGANEIDVHAPCSMCSSTHENWLCLTCYQVFCGRYVRGHMVSHFQTSKHAIVLSFADLSSWCYECDCYIHNEQLNTAKREAHIAKFGVAQPESSSSRNHQ